MNRFPVRCQWCDKSLNGKVGLAPWGNHHALSLCVPCGDAIDAYEDSLTGPRERIRARLRARHSEHG
jgi:hypothetical protein